jgi:hypothetical protein
MSTALEKIKILRNGRMGVDNFCGKSIMAPEKEASL